MAYAFDHEHLYELDTIDEAITNVSKSINRHYSFKDPKEPLIVLCVLKGGIQFCSRLLPYLETEKIQLEYFWASAYLPNGTLKSLEVKMLFDARILENRNVLIVDDIYDTGRTIDTIVGICYAHKAKSVKSTVLLDKPFKRKGNEHGPDFIAIPMGHDYWVYGFGMEDDNGYYRELPCICIKGGKK